MRDERERDKRAVVAGAGAPPNAYLSLVENAVENRESESESERGLQLGN